MQILQVAINIPIKKYDHKKFAELLKSSKAKLVSYSVVDNATIQVVIEVIDIT